MDLFGDLPEPTGGSSNGSEEKTKDSIPGPAASAGEKRKLEETGDGDGSSPEKKLANDSSGMYGLRSYHADRKGEREDMEDAYTLLSDFKSLVKEPHQSLKRLSYFAVFDGHGGARASKYAAENLHKNLALNFPKGDQSAVEKDIKKKFTEVFKKTDDAFLKIGSKPKPSWKDGSTVVSVLVVNNTLFVANLGDSKAVLCRYQEPLQKCVAIALTKDHSPSLYEERIRIQKRGGRVEEGRVMGVLEVSRSIGDGPYKRHGVTCVPDVKRCQLTAHDKYILIACDGLWKRFSNETAIEFINEILQDESITATESKSAMEMRYEKAVNQLASEAVRRLSADNVTVVLVAIQPT